MNNVDWVITRDVYPQKCIHVLKISWDIGFCSKNILGISKYILRDKSLTSFFTSLVFVYKSMSLKRFRIEQLCPSIDGMISIIFVRYAII